MSTKPPAWLSFTNKSDYVYSIIIAIYYYTLSHFLCQYWKITILGGFSLARADCAIMRHNQTYCKWYFKNTTRTD
jgi:hypothetical protein